MSERSVTISQQCDKFDDLKTFLIQQAEQHPEAWLWLDPMAVIKKGTSGGKWQDFPIWSKLSEQVRWLEDAMSQGLKINEGRVFFDQGSVHFVCTDKKSHAGRYYQLIEQTNGESEAQAREEQIYQRQDVERYGFTKISNEIQLTKITYWQGNRPIGWRIDVLAKQPKAIIA